METGTSHSFSRANSLEKWSEFLAFEPQRHLCLWVFLLFCEKMLESKRTRPCRWLRNECWNQPSEFRRSGEPSVAWHFESKLCSLNDDSIGSKSFCTTQWRNWPISYFLSYCNSLWLTIILCRCIVFLFFALYSGVSYDCFAIIMVTWAFVCLIKHRLNFVDSNYTIDNTQDSFFALELDMAIIFRERQGLLL